MTKDIEARVLKVVQGGLDTLNKQGVIARFAEDLGADSLDMVSLALAIEREFDIEVMDDKLEQWVTVGDAVAYVRVTVG